MIPYQLKNIFLVLLLVVTFNCNAQKPDPPVLKQINLIKNTNNVQLFWDPAVAPEVIVYIDNPNDPGSIPGWIIVDTVPNIGSYIDLDADAIYGPRIYKLKSYNGERSDNSELFATTFLELEFDTCSHTTYLEWTNYVDALYGEGDVTFNFEIYRNDILIGGPISGKSFTDNNVSDNTTYEYHIKAYPTHYPSLGSISNYITLSTDISQSPDYINSKSTIVNGKNTNINFEIAPNSEISNYKLLKSESPTGSFDTLKNITTTDLEISTTHSNSKPTEDINYYKLVSVNNCGRVTTHSSVINNIVLEIDNIEFTNTLTWNLLKDFDLVSANYKIYRSQNDEPAVSVHNQNNISSFTENIEYLRDENTTNKFCYYIRAYDNSDINGNYSQSNTACIFLEPVIYIPEAFTPNGDGRNDVFNPKFSFTPSKFELKIYNRWGNMIFSTSDFQKGWEGNGLNNSKVPAGSYLYTIYIKLPDNQIIEKQGNVIVIYP